MEPFTLRHRKALVEKRLKVSISPQLRERLWQFILSHDEQWQHGWNECTSHLEETENKLRRLLGLGALVAKTQKGNSQGLEAYFREGYPSNVLEVVEQFYDQLPDDKRRPLTVDVNNSMRAFKCPWLLLDGAFYKVDDHFLAELIDTSQAVLVERGFGGAVDEMREARENLTALRSKEAIVAALKSIESTVKTIVNTPSGAAKDLFIKFREAGYMDDIPLNCAKAIVSAVLPCVAVLRNELGGHGQGLEVVNVPQAYASLAIHLAAAINLFLLEQSAMKGVLPAQLESPSISTDLDVPF